MRVHSVYVIVDDGRCAFFKSYSEDAPSQDLVAAMLTAMQSFIREVTGSYFSELTAGPFSFVSEVAGPFQVVMVTSKSDKAVETVQHLGMRFMRKYKQLIENWKGETIDFEDFIIDVNEVVGIGSETLRVDPKNPLNAATLVFLPPELQNIAVGLIQIDQITAEDLAVKLKIDPAIALERCESLLELGHIGKEQNSEGTFYFAR